MLSFIEKITVKTTCFVLQKFYTFNLLLFGFEVMRILKPLTHRPDYLLLCSQEHDVAHWLVLTFSVVKIITFDVINLF